MKNLSLLIVKLLLSSALLLVCSSSVLALTDEDRAMFREAVDALENGNYEKEFRLLEQLVEKGPERLGLEGFQIARSMLYEAAVKMAYSRGESRCATALMWATKGTRYGPPDYTEQGDDYYPMLLAVKGSCLQDENRKAESEVVLSHARKECQNISAPEFREELCAKIDKWVKVFRESGITVGDYVTHRNGLLQKWIGRVVGRNGSKLEVRITYVKNNAGVGFDKGDSVSFLQDEVKQVQTISVDAALRGWK